MVGSIALSFSALRRGLFPADTLPAAHWTSDRSESRATCLQRVTYCCPLLRSLRPFRQYLTPTSLGLLHSSPSPHPAHPLNMPLTRGSRSKSPGQRHSRGALLFLQTPREERMHIPAGCSQMPTVNRNTGLPTGCGSTSSRRSLPRLAMEAVALPGPHAPPIIRPSPAGYIVLHTFEPSSPPTALPAPSDHCLSLSLGPVLCCQSAKLRMEAFPPCRSSAQ